MQQQQTFFLLHFRLIFVLYITLLYVIHIAFMMWFLSVAFLFPFAFKSKGIFCFIPENASSFTFCCLSCFKIMLLAQMCLSDFWYTKKTWQKSSLHLNVFSVFVCSSLTPLLSLSHSLLIRTTSSFCRVCTSASVL